MLRVREAVSAFLVRDIVPFPCLCLPQKTCYMHQATPCFLACSMVTFFLISLPCTFVPAAGDLMHYTIPLPWVYLGWLYIQRSLGFSSCLHMRRCGLRLAFSVRALPAWKTVPASLTWYIATLRRKLVAAVDTAFRCTTLLLGVISLAILPSSPFLFLNPFRISPCCQVVQQ
ncbi:hypothetical protein DEU56DRAFT_787659 [Suillus clintonianus]|uniref:uncharacterized protein n=1 Tax=Suillus clintonianus TaxID=1904413 RepID=UPI001B86129C|nr:uncharacterized protein DEU56DRAFT_787659 [Suillus clintonianus]KAG2146349.1 hypothetical protein DEU56DRAFT_787659 [Suillus clintonianus]